MDARVEQGSDANDPAAGAIPEIETAGLTIILCVLIVAVCFAVPVLLKLPRAMDAASRPGPTLREMSVSAAQQPVEDERKSGPRAIEGEQARSLVNASER